jgi:hypothetical protein
MRFPTSLLLPVLALALHSPARGGQVELQPTADGVRILIDGELFTQYHGSGAQRPYLYPIIGPSGANLARPYPMEKGGAEDHKHHRSLWFAHGKVNGVDFWADGDKHGRQEHQAVNAAVADGNSAAFTTTTRWVTADGKPVLTDERRIGVRSLANGARAIDFTITLTASEGPVLFGDTKEGTFALRVGPSLTHEGEGAAGSILSSTGKKDGAVWGKQAPWVCYHGPDPKGERVSVSILEHPSNFRHPTWWHARTYGLFAANPFGKADFEKLDDKSAGDHALAAGQSLSLRYLVLIQPGDPSPEAIQAEFTAFSAAPAP